VEDTSVADFRAHIETNLFGVIIMTKAALPHFRERRAGHIIQVASIAGRIGPIGRAPYAAAKFGVEGFSESLYKEVGPLGIKVTIVEPGGFRTDFAGISTDLREGRPEYDATVGATVRFHGIMTASNQATPRRQPRRFYTLRHLATRLCGSCWEAIRITPPNRLHFKNSSWTENGKISVSQLTTHPTTFLPDDALWRHTRSRQTKKVRPSFRVTFSVELTVSNCV